MSLFVIADREERKVRKTLTDTNATDIIAAGDNRVTLHQVHVANIGSVATFDLYVTDGTTTTYLAKTESLAAASRVLLDLNVPIDGNERLVAKASAGNTFDIIAIYMGSPQRAR